MSAKKQESPVIVSDSDISDWLSNKEVISSVLSCTDEVMDTLKKHKETKSGQSGLLLTAVKSSFVKLYGCMASLYPTARADSVTKTTAHRDRFSLTRLLGKGLTDILATCPLQQKVKLIPTQLVLTSLQEQVLAFIKMLHDSEMERKRLRKRVSSLGESEQQLREIQQRNENLQLELSVIKNQHDKMVAVEKFDGVVSELESTLTRERLAQQLLHEQGDKLRELSRRLDDEERKREQQENRLKDSIQSIERSKDDVLHKAETIQQLKSRISRLELEKTQLQNNVIDAEQAVKNVFKDRDYMSAYVKNLLAAFDKCRTEIVKTDVTKALGAECSLPPCEPTSEMLGIQTLIRAYLDSVRSLHARITGLNDEISSHTKHISRLKEELLAACSRQLTVPATAQGGVDDIQHPDRYSRMVSTRLTHYQDMNCTPRFDKSFEIESEADFISLGNEPDISNCELSSTGKPASKIPPATNPNRTLQKRRPRTRSAFQPVTKSATLTTGGVRKERR